MSNRSFTLTADLLLRAYRLGLFPMAESRGSRTLHWLDPEARGILPMDGFHLPRSLAKTLRSNRFTITADQNFAGVIAACAAARANRPDTWINLEIERLFTELHHLGFAHSVETWENGALVGGLYGASLGGAFFGESMFSTVTDASKAALVHLVARLRLGGFVLLDTQFITAHLARFGAVEIPRVKYHTLLATAVEAPARFPENLDFAVLAAEIEAMRSHSKASDSLKILLPLLMILGITPAFADQRPAFLPLRDVVVDYTLSVPNRPDAAYQLSYEAAGQLARIDDPVRGIYVLANLPAGSAELVVPALHSIVTAPDVAGITGEIYSAGGARFTPLGHGNFAGLACEKYLILSSSGSATACLTPDGVALYFNGRDAHGSAEVTATSVSYAPQSPDEFAAPDGFGAISLPPDALAQLLGP